MIVFIEALPAWLIVVVFLTVTALASVAIVRAIQILFPIKHSDGLSVTVKSLITFRLTGAASVILGFAIVMSNAAFQDSIMKAAEEAHQIERISLLIDGLDEPSKTQIRDALTEYAKSVVGDEWQNMRVSDPYDGHPVTKQRLNGVLKSIKAAQSKAESHDFDFDGILRAEEQAELLRQNRLTYAHQEVPIIFWGLAFAIFLMINGLGAFLEMDRVHHNLLFVVVNSAIVGLLASFLFIMSHPFSANESVSPHAMERVIMALEGRT